MGGVAHWRARRHVESELADGLVRGAVAETLGVDSDQVRLGRVATGGVRVEEPPDTQVAVSISYGRGLVGCAVAVGCAVGIDVERERDIGRWERLADAYLTERERARVAESDSPGAALLRLLSRKEALLKAAGIGVSMPLASVDVLDGEVTPPGGPTAVTMWSVRTLEAPEGWLVTVAAGTTPMRLEVSWAGGPGG